MVIESQENLNDDLRTKLDNEFEKYAKSNNLKCNYKTFNFIAKGNNTIVGILTGHSLYDEIFIDNLIVFDGWRQQGIGTALVKQVENSYLNKNFKCMSLVSHEFLAPNFYKKLGFNLEFTRKNIENPKLTKYFFIKYFS